MNGDDGYEDAVILIDGVPLDELLMKPPRAKTKHGGTKEGKIWGQIVAHLRASFPDSEPPPHRNAAFHAVKDWLTGGGRTLDDSTIRRGIRRHFPKWPPDDKR